MLLIAALTLGGVSYWGFTRYVQERVTRAEANVTDAFELEPRIVAAQDLAAGTVLTPQHLAARRVPAGFALSNALRPESVGELLGRTLAQPVRPGDTIVKSMLQPREAPIFSEQIAAGSRAVTVPVDEVNAIAGLLAPGDRVDLLYCAERQRLSGAPRPEVRLLLSGVLVLATGRATRKTRVQGPDGSEREIDTAFNTATLSVSPRDAQLIALAQRTGELVAALRSPRDATPLRLDTLGADALAGEQPRRVARRRVRSVELIVGGQGAAPARWSLSTAPQEL